MDDMTLKVVKTTTYDDMAVRYDLRVGTTMILSEHEARHIPDEFVAAMLANQLREFVNISPLDKLVQEKVEKPDELRYKADIPMDSAKSPVNRPFAFSQVSEPL